MPGKDPRGYHRVCQLSKWTALLQGLVRDPHEEHPEYEPRQSSPWKRHHNCKPLNRHQPPVIGPKRVAHRSTQFCDGCRNQTDPILQAEPKLSPTGSSKLQKWVKNLPSVRWKWFWYAAILPAARRRDQNKNQAVVGRINLKYWALGWERPAPDHKRIPSSNKSPENGAVDTGEEEKMPHMPARILCGYAQHCRLD